MANNVTSLTALNTPLVDKDGKLTWQWLKWFQGIQQAVNAGLNLNGQFIGNIGPGVSISSTAVVEGRTEGIGVTLQNIDSTGVIIGPGIDFNRPYSNKNTDHIGDGTGSPLSGGKAAYTALVQTPPTAQPHKWINGFSAGLFTQSQPAYSDISGTPQLANTITAATHKWLASYDATTGNFTQTQPAYSDISGTPAPILSATSGSLGGSAMTVGQRITTNVTVTGATTSMVASCSPTSDPGAGFVWHAYVSSSNTVTVCLTCVLAGTPASTTYAVRVIQ